MACPSFAIARRKRHSHVVICARCGTRTTWRYWPNSGLYFVVDFVGRFHFEERHDDPANVAKAVEAETDAEKEEVAEAAKAVEVARSAEVAFLRDELARDVCRGRDWRITVGIGSRSDLIDSWKKGDLKGFSKIAEEMDM